MVCICSAFGRQVRSPHSGPVVWIVELRCSEATWFFLGTVLGGIRAMSSTDKLLPQGPSCHVPSMAGHRVASAAVLCVSTVSREIHMQSSRHLYRYALWRLCGYTNRAARLARFMFRILLGWGVSLQPVVNPIEPTSRHLGRSDNFLHQVLQALMLRGMDAPEVRAVANVGHNPHRQYRIAWELGFTCRI